MSKINYFEIQADNTQRAMNFYEDAFGWKFTGAEMEQGYWQFEAGPAHEPGLNGGLFKRQFPGGNLITIYVQSLDDALERVVKAGGKIIHPKLPVTGHGWAAYITDSEG